MHWSLRTISTNFNGIEFNLWPCLTQLAKAKYGIILLQNKIITDLKADGLVHYICEAKTNGVVYTNNATGTRSLGTAILLSAEATSITKER